MHYDSIYIKVIDILFRHPKWISINSKLQNRYCTLSKSISIKGTNSQMHAALKKYPFHPHTTQGALTLSHALPLGLHLSNLGESVLRYEKRG